MNFEKIGVVLSHEYSVRVRKKSFILTTLLTPLLVGLVIVVPSLIMLLGDDEKQTVRVVDESGYCFNYLEGDKNLEFEPSLEGETLESLKACFPDTGLYAIVGISGFDANGDVSVVAYSSEPLNMEAKSTISKGVSKAVEQHKLEAYDIADLDKILEDIKSDIKVDAITLSEDGKEKKDAVEIYMAMAYVMSFLIYIFVFVFGTMVMRSVIDEKSSRVVEVVVSSVKTIDLMFGKIIGVALVALTQFTIWVVFTVAIVAGANAIMGPKLLATAAQGGQIAQITGDATSAVDVAGIVQLAEATGTTELTGTTEVTDLTGTAGALESEDAVPSGETNMVMEIISLLKDMNWGYILGCFIIYFLLGYLLYASMFAAIGAAVDNETDTGQLQMPVTIPLMLGLFIMLHTFQHPGSSLSFWASVIPFTSPMVMLARIPFGSVPGWQLILSIVLLLLTFIAIAYFAAKIYKAGILMYGKKTTFKDLWKWMNQKD